MKKFLGVLCLLLVLAMAVPSSATASTQLPAASPNHVIEKQSEAVNNAPCGHYDVCGGGPCCACGRFRGGPTCVVCCSELNRH